MSTRKIFILLLSFFILLNSCEAQKLLVLYHFKLTGLKRIRFQEGDVINVRLDDFNKKTSGEILYISDSSIGIKEMDVPLETIRIIYRDKTNYLTRSFAKFFMWAGLGFVILDTGNNLLTGNPVVLNERAVMAGVPLVLAGLLLNKAFIKKYRIGARNTLKIIDISM